MEYTYQEKCVALVECRLWWRFPDGKHQEEREWSKITDDFSDIHPSDIQKPNAEYHIGDEPPKPARVWSKLELELLAALEEADEDFAREGFGPDSSYRAHLIAAIAKAKGEA